MPLCSFFSEFSQHNVNLVLLFPFHRWGICRLAKIIKQFIQGQRASKCSTWILIQISLIPKLSIFPLISQHYSVLGRSRRNQVQILYSDIHNMSHFYFPQVFLQDNSICQTNWKGEWLTHGAETLHFWILALCLTCHMTLALLSLNFLI